MKSKKSKEKKFLIRKCPKCCGDNVGIVIGTPKGDEWECRKCKWNGKDIKEIELNEQIKEETSPRDVFMQYLQEKINELPDKEKQKFEKSREMNPIEIILKAAEKFQSQNQEEVNYLETSENDE